MGADLHGDGLDRRRGTPYRGYSLAMGVGGWIVTGVGVALLATVVSDVVSTTIHPDREGRLSRALQGALWRVHTAVARRLRHSARRRLAASAGPVLVISTLAMWVGLFILAFALMVWPHMDGGYSSDRIDERGFIDALYYSGITGTVLGYGDITPVHWLSKVTAFVQSALGFALLTLIITHLLTVLDGVGRRDQVSLRVWGESDGTFDGVRLVERSLRSEGADALRERLENLAQGTRMMQERFHRFPMYVFYLRSADPVYDPERTVKAIGEAALAGQLAAVRHPAVRVAAEHLERAVRHFMDIVAHQYLSPEGERRLRDAHPRDVDRAAVASAAEQLGVDDLDGERLGADDLAQLAFHVRVFLEELDRLTRWRLLSP